ncbi:hypothetical protein ACFQ9J_21240 [Streptomyces sp. NPDC056529]|uniref:hypothetical protein n=1 Tax=Streptomyces sp. NPDC056529 TaxID=3345855 RepID=UPI00367C77B9
MEHDTATPVTGAYPDELRLALLTAAEAREAVELLQLLERLDPGGRAVRRRPRPPPAHPLRLVQVVMTPRSGEPDGVRRC